MVNKKNRRGGSRPNSGRPPRDKNVWGQITCVLRHDTIQKLKEGAGGKQQRFGKFLQWHLDRHPLPSREIYLELSDLQERSRNHLNPERERLVRELRRKERAEQRRAQELAKMSPQARKRQLAFEKTYLQLKRDEAKLATK